MTDIPKTMAEALERKLRMHADEIEYLLGTGMDYDKALARVYAEKQFTPQTWAKIVAMVPEPMDYEEYASIMGAHPDWGDAGTHKTSVRVSTAAHKSMMNNLSVKNAQLQELRDALRIEYDELVANGTYRPRTRIERLIRVARGHEDNQSTQSARCILDKMGVYWDMNLD